MCHQWELPVFGLDLGLLIMVCLLHKQVGRVSAIFLICCWVSMDDMNGEKGQQL